MTTDWLSAGATDEDLRVLAEQDAAREMAIERYSYRYAWGPRWPGVCGGGFSRKGQLCHIVARGAMNSALVEFQDGYRAVISRNALRRVKL